MPLSKITRYLDDNHVPYQVIHHSKAYTAQQIASSAHIPGREMAKTVIVKLDGKLTMIVLPASYKLNFDLLAEATGAESAILATEKEFKNLFDGCETGAMPPFGNLFGMDVFVAESLIDDEEIAFNAGNHTELIKIGIDDFDRLVHPKVLHCSYKMNY